MAVNWVFFWVVTQNVIGWLFYRYRKVPKPYTSKIICMVCELHLSVSYTLELCMKFFVVLFFETGFLFSPACPGTWSIDQTGLKLTEIQLSLPLECWD